MKQRWWIAIVAVLGIGLAILLFPRPDTGGTVQPPAEGEDGQPAVVEAPQGGVAATAPGAKRQGPRGGKGKRPAVKPPSVLQERRSRPEVIYASKIVTPFSAIRYTLSRMKDDPGAKALSDEVGKVANGEIRTMRMDPDSIDWDSLQRATDAVIQQVRQSPYASDPTIAKALERYGETVTEYHQTKENGGTPPVDPDREPPATPGGAPDEEME
ncbi:MAG: hypothetical protein R3F59_15475 [Myxococcota bacterium]